MARRKVGHRRAPARPDSARLRSEVAGIVLLVAAAAAALALAEGPGAGGVVGTQLAAGLRWVLGRAAWVLPPLMAVRAVEALLGTPASRTRPRQAGLVLAVVLVAVAAARPCPDLWSATCFRTGGGLVGTVAGWALARAFGVTGALVAWVALGVLAVRLISGIPLAAMAAAGGRGVAAAARRLRRWAGETFLAAEADEPAAGSAASTAAASTAAGGGPAAPVTSAGAGGGRGGTGPDAGADPSGEARGGAEAGTRGRPWWRRWWGGRAREGAATPGPAPDGRALWREAGADGDGALGLPGLQRLVERALQDGGRDGPSPGEEPAEAEEPSAGAAGAGAPAAPLGSPARTALAEEGRHAPMQAHGPHSLHAQGAAHGPGTPRAAGAAPPGEPAAGAAPSPAADAGAEGADLGPRAGSSAEGASARSGAAQGGRAAAGRGGASDGPGAPASPAGPMAPSPTYRLPPLELLSRGRQGSAARRQREILEKAATLQDTLASFGVQARIVDVAVGPAVTRFEVEPARGVKVSKIQALASDIALSLAVPDVRIEAPIPGKAAVGIEVPNREVVAVQLRDVLETPEFARSRSKLTVALGQDIAGQPVVTSLDKLVHLLIAGATGSGKSVCINALITSLLFKARPDEVKLLLIDPKVVELSAYDGIPHLIAPVITDARKAAGALQWAVREMEQRYERFAKTGVRDVSRYNLRALQQGEPPLPLMVVVIDELADLMMVAPVEVEDAIQRLAQMARAAGIHLVVATQRPSVDVITGVIKANIPSRIAFAVSSQTDSRVILDGAGAEKLVGRGDMLFLPVGATKPVRVQGAYISEKDLEAVLAFLRRQARPDYDPEVMRAEVEASEGPAAAEDDDLFPQAVRVVLEAGQASVSLIQRRLRVGYTRAGRLIDMMEERGYIGPHQGAKPRDVLITWEEFRRRHGDGGLPPAPPSAPGAGAP
ncbi:FtsK/SpoIIIE family DNA translocase [Thermaerobacter composti]|uniref:DNA translocase FtsK 4TM domain-containing protein n=1 Tax=Thermaerobacter composti TaxID=554949 RepID=A0ABZ0QR79_9FIRM|nr:DNA translocase FtsK 4TM domain-containing protein [Thermaerobacter composti]WPD20025.1 DNA translocase FtsK 4TM domain-containing protein [Thermaerobacter composti]